TAVPGPDGGSRFPFHVHPGDGRHAWREAVAFTQVRHFAVPVHPEPASATLLHGSPISDPGLRHAKRRQGPGRVPWARLSLPRTGWGSMEFEPASLEGRVALL